MIAPRAAQVDAEGRVPGGLLPGVPETGLLGVAIPEEYGGAGLGCLGLVLAVEEVAKHCCTAG